eukprot:jgi/Antlo1/945/259
MKHAGHVFKYVFGTLTTRCILFMFLLLESVLKIRQ